MLKDLLWALRWLRLNPAFTAAVIAILALGIGANTAVFSIVDAVLLRPLPYKSADRLFRIEETLTKRPSLKTVGAQDYLRLRERRDVFEETAAHLTDFVTVLGAGDPQQIVSRRVSANLFSMLGVHARLGRTLLESGGEFNAPHEVVLSDRLWRRVFNSDRNVLGKGLTIADEAYTIVGVMPTEFDFPSGLAEMWIPLYLTPASKNLVEIVARTKPGVSMAQAQSAMKILASQIEQETPAEKAGLQINVSEWREVTSKQYEMTLVFVLVAVGLVLLIACADIGGLLLSRAVQRQREIAIRASLGAGFWRVARQLFVESAALAVLGSIAGIAIAHYGLQFLVKQLASLPFVLPHLQGATLNSRVLIFNTALSALLACLFSAAPLFLASKTDLQAVLRSGPSAGRPAGSARLFSLLIAGEAAFAFLLLVSSGLMIQSLTRLQQADHGLRPDHVLTLRVPVGSLTQNRPTGKFDTKQRQMAYYRELLGRIERVPGVSSAAVVNNLPMSSVNTSVQFVKEDGALATLSARTISNGYFSALGIPLLGGRFFTADDQSEKAASAAIVNRYLAHQLFPDRDAVGQKVTFPDGAPTTIVGVVADTPQMSYEHPSKGEIYLPYQRAMFAVFMSSLVVRTSSDPMTVAAALRKEVWAVNPDQPIVRVETMDDIIANSIWRPRFSAFVFSFLGGLALLLTCVGVYSVIAYTTTLRAREIGIRIALGATPQNVVAVVLKDALIPLVAGLVVSIVAAIFLSRLLAGLLYEITATDPLTYIAAALILIAIGGVASARPAWRVATGDPLPALRAD